MGRGLGGFQREVLQRIGRGIATAGEARVSEIARDMALVRGLPTEITDDLGDDHKLDVAHRLGLRRALATLERRGLIVRYVGGWVQLTEEGALVAGDCQPWTRDAISAEMNGAVDAFRRRRAEAIAAGRLKPNGQVA
jgi:DNA-binding PucR family transcriptional regulator